MNFKYAHLLILAGLLGSASAHGDIIEIISGEGTACEYEAGLDGIISGLPTDCETVAIAPHSLWQTNDPLGRGAVWVSYAETGVDGSGASAPTDTNSPLFTIVETFEITSAGSIDFWIWADDTADLYFNLATTSEPTSIWSANFSQNICANGQIGCEPHEGYNMVLDLAPGSYDITMSMWQIGTGATNQNNPFGVLYSGAVTHNVPEPGTLALFGIGLLGLGATRRRRKA